MWFLGCSSLYSQRGAVRIEGRLGFRRCLRPRPSERSINSPPRVLYLLLGAGDEWAHEGRYDLYLDATTRADRFIERIWTTPNPCRAFGSATRRARESDRDHVAIRRHHRERIGRGLSEGVASRGPFPPAARRVVVKVNPAERTRRASSAKARRSRRYCRGRGCRPHEVYVDINAHYRA